MIADDFYDGLIAEWYDEWLKDRRDDVSYYAAVFAGFRGCALELACGSGRVLLPIAKQGVAIDGLDSSRDMLAKLAARLKAEGAKAGWYQQSMAHFDLPHRYDAVFIAAGSFQLLITDEEVAGCLESVRRHLRPGGFFLLDVFVPWEAIRQQKTAAFTVARANQRGDGTRCVVAERFEVDAARQVVRSIFRYEVFRNGRFERSLLRDFPLRWYWEDELAGVLRRAGFSGVELLADSPLSLPGTWFVFKATAGREQRFG